MMLHSADSRQAYTELKKVKRKIAEKEIELDSLNQQRRIFEKYLCVLEGSCQECQNAHFPHCSEEDS